MPEMTKRIFLQNRDKNNVMLNVICFVTGAINNLIYIVLFCQKIMFVDMIFERACRMLQELYITGTEFCEIEWFDNYRF